MALDPLLARLLPELVAEAGELVADATRALMRLERQVDPAAAEVALRALHTLKGSSATLGLEEPAALAHALEDALAPRLEAPLGAEALDVVLAALDALMAHVRGRARGEEGSSLEAALARVRALEAAGAPGPLGPGASAPPQWTPPTSEGAATSPGADAPAGEEGGTGRGELEAEWRVRGADVEALGREVERVRELRLRLDARRHALERVAEALDGEARLDVARVARGLAADGEEAAELVADLEGAIRAVSTLPARAVLEPLHRAVRDLCRRTGKQARLSLVGDDVALDRRLLGTLQVALVHLVRNAVDHGIEPPDVREARGKDREGLLTVRLELQGNALLVEVSDDGGGVDAAALREAAVRRGVLGAERAAALSDEEARRLVFAARLSTRDAADATSGRGVGLDAVREHVEARQGRLALESRAGQGTTFQLTLPLALGGTGVLLVAAGEHRVGLPLGMVEAVRAPAAEDLRGSGRGARLVRGEDLLEVHDLGALLGVRQPLAARPGRPHVLVHAGGRRAALAVDAVLGHDDLVVRPLPDELGPLPAYLGAATLAQGELLLLLRPGWVFERADGAASAGDAAAGQPRALVVDDALTARAMHRAAPEAAGWAVQAASSAAQALARLAEDRYDALVTDLRLAGESGLDLLARARARRLDLPVVVVSGQDDDATRRACLDAGADAFVAKRDCAQGALAAEVAGAVARRRARR